MTKAEFERAKQLEKEIKKINDGLCGLKKCFSYGDTVISTLGLVAFVNIPENLRETIYNQLREEQETQLAELEKELAELVSD